MRAIHLVRLDKVRPAVVLTRSEVLGRVVRISVAPITSTVRGLAVEVPVDQANGLDRPSVINCDNMQTVSTSDVGRYIGALLKPQEIELAAAIIAAYALEAQAGGAPAPMPK